MIIFGLLHIAISCLLAYVLGFFFGEINFSISLASLLLSLPIIAYLLNYQSVDFTNLKIASWRHGTAGVLEKIVFLVVIFVGFRHFLFLYYQIDNEVRSLHPFNLGDLPLHIHYIRNFAAGVDFPPRNPNFPTEFLRYPFGIDLYNALWESVGVPTSAHLFVTGFFCTIASLVCLRLVGSWLLMVAFFFSGGFIAVMNGSPQTMIEMLSWKNLFLSMFITQRGFIWALPVGVLLFYFLYLGARRKPTAPIKQRTLITMAILWGSLGLFHLHTFFVLSIMIFAMAIYRVRRQKLNVKAELRKYIFVWIWPLLMGGYFVLYSLNFFKAGGIIHWHWGWTWEPKQNFLSYLSVNFGTYLLLVIGLGVYLIRHKLKHLYFEFFLAIALFILFFNLILAPWAWDNIKVLVWPYLAIVALAHEVIRKHWSTKTQIILLIVLSYGGLYALSGPQFSMNGHVMLYTNSEIAFAEAATKGLPVNAVFASGTTFNHELTALGRTRAIGYDGHLWAHGIQYADKKQKLISIMSGTEHWLDDAHDLRVNYIYWGPKERAEFAPFGVSQSWRSQLKNVSRIKDYEVYEVP